MNFPKSLTAADFNFYKNKKITTLEIDVDNHIKAANMLRWYFQLFSEKKGFSISEQKRIIKSMTLKDIQQYFNLLFKNVKGTVIIMGTLSQKKKNAVKEIWRNWKI